MNKKITILFALIIITAAGAFLFLDSQPKLPNSVGEFQIQTVQFQGKPHRFLIADTPEKQEKGLMFFRSLPQADGMLFVFSEKQILSFWNKNTRMNLKLYWLNDDEIVGTSQLPSIEVSKEIVTVTSPKPANKVLEIPE
ncbi:DUF192 domain-containing protein [Candidatus Roizmanbacteria bacterium]|nr:DUF192 domain-containing protein [Candidatus Roizmanbacteria bacterium]